MTEPKSLGQLELEVLKIVWDHPGSSVPQLTDALLQNKDYARTTILTVVQRLHKKSFLTREKQDGAFRYYPTDSKESVMGGMTKRFIEKTFDGSASSLIQHLTQTKLSTAELEEMRSIIDQAMKNEEQN
ncbi:BlaI/MecI/CopY family transcriptional regulator [Pontiellaceae bacterium B1224]|nr:BlaI/MecI/CopY family transcriptional regulator [Pontiellaceae bacterium B1224]